MHVVSSACENALDGETVSAEIGESLGVDRSSREERPLSNDPARVQACASAAISACEDASEGLIAMYTQSAPLVSVASNAGSMVSKAASDNNRSWADISACETANVGMHASEGGDVTQGSGFSRRVDRSSREERSPSSERVASIQAALDCAGMCA